MIMSKCNNLGEYVFQSTMNYFKGIIQNKQNNKWFLLVFLFIVVDGLTTYIGLKYELMIELNPIMNYLIGLFNLEFAMSILIYVKYLVIILLYEFFKMAPSPINWAAFYAIFSMSAFVAVNNTLLILWALIA